MRDIIVSAIFSFLIYDEEDGIEKMKKFFPAMKTLLYPIETDTDYFGVFSPFSGLNVIAVRGTDGTDPVKKIKAWLRNFNYHPGWNGIADGFENSAMKIYESIHHMVDNRTIVVGQSAGAAISPIVTYLFQVNQHKDVDSIVFSVPPPGNIRFKEEFYRVECNCKSYTRYGDPIIKYFRKGKGKINSGCDVGIKKVFPKLNWWESVPFLRTFAHSPRKICDALIAYEANDTEEIETLKRLKKLCVN